MSAPECHQLWNPTLGLINDLRDLRATFPAAALSRARALLFVPSSDYISTRAASRQSPLPNPSDSYSQCFLNKCVMGGIYISLLFFLLCSLKLPNNFHTSPTQKTPSSVTSASHLAYQQSRNTELFCMIHEPLIHSFSPSRSPQLLSAIGMGTWTSTQGPLSCG